MTYCRWWFSSYLSFVDCKFTSQTIKAFSCSCKIVQWLCQILQNHRIYVFFKIWNPEHLIYNIIEAMRSSWQTNLSESEWHGAFNLWCFYIQCIAHSLCLISPLIFHQTCSTVRKIWTMCWFTLQWSRRALYAVKGKCIFI